jgi:hypothetical protein
MKLHKEGKSVRNIAEITGVGKNALQNRIKCLV